MSEPIENNNVEGGGPSPVEIVKSQIQRTKDHFERDSKLIDDIWDSEMGTKEKASEKVKENKVEDLAPSVDPSSGEKQKAPEKTPEEDSNDAWDEVYGDDDEDEDEEDENTEIDEEDENEDEDEGDEDVDDENFFSAEIEGEEGEENQVLKIPKNAKISIPVDGEEQIISMQDYANGISGQKAISQKFTALDGERKAFEDGKQWFEDSRAVAKELIDDNKAVEAIEKVSEMMGMDPNLIFTVLFEQIIPELEAYSKLEDGKKEIWASNLKNKKAELKAKSAQDQLKKLQASQAQQQKVVSVREAYGLDEASFTSAYHAVEAEMEAGTLKKQPVTPELVGQYVKLVRYEGLAEKALKGTEYEGNQGAINQVLQAVNQMNQQGQDITEQAVMDLVAQATGREQQIKKAKKVKKSLEKKGVKPQAKGNKKAKKIRRKDPSGKPQSWMENALTSLDEGTSAADLGLIKKRE